MCKISDKIKFCTCSDVENLAALGSYWILHQPDEDNDEFVIGTCAEPTSFTDPNFEFNEGVILERLNDGKAFDKPFEFVKNDRLEVVIKVDDVRGSFNYNFKYSGRKWKALAEDVFGLMNHYKHHKQGAISEELK
jgi:hypothetical protein